MLALAFLLLALSSGPIACHRFGTASEADAGRVVAFINANVVPMDSERILESQTVIVRNGRVAALGPAGEVAVPREAVRVSHEDAYLMPGLADMHAHVDRDSDLILFLANGVTTVRNMAGGPQHLERRQRVELGELPGPTMYTAGPIIDGPVELWPGNTAPPLDPGEFEVITTRLEGERVVREQVALGYDFVKVYDNLPADAYEGVVAAAAELGVPVVGHVPFGVGLSNALESGLAAIEHLRGYVHHSISADAPLTPGWDKRSRFLAWNHLDPSRVAHAVEATAAAGVWNVPTLTRYQKNMLPTAEHLERYASPEARFLPPSVVERLIGNRSLGARGRYGSFSEQEFQGGHTVFEAKKGFVRELKQAGARILVGSDDWFAGFATHQELENLVAAGLSPFESLVAATRDAATFLGREDEWGQIEIGRSADLLLVRGNPLVDVKNARNLLGVMVRGRWHTRHDLQQRLAELAASYERERASDLAP